LHWHLFCAVAEPPPLTEDRIAAIRADPRASKYVRVVLGCKKCPAKLYVTAGLEKPRALDGIEKIWHEDASDEWKCRCSSTVINLTSIRKNLHGLLGRPVTKGEDESEISFIRMYEKGALTDVCGEFGALLDDNPPEEEVQKFLEKSTVFLHRFSPMRIKPKAPVLIKNQTDFAVLDSRGVLILVEIERPGIRLLKKDGDVSQPLQHAFDQVRTWLDTTRRRWTAVLDCMGFKEMK
jgi:antiviral defense system Shedu protein SduA